MPRAVDPLYEYTPVRSSARGLVHATSLREPGITACGRRYNGWMVEPSLLTCRQCKLVLFKDARKRR